VVEPADFVTYTLVVRRINGFSGAVTLATNSDLPSGAQVGL